MIIRRPGAAIPPEKGLTMEFWEKEEAFERRQAQRRIAVDVWKYIPVKLYEAVTRAFSDSDGYWIWLDHEDGGWVAYDGGEDCGTIHEYTIKDLKEAIKTIRKGV